MSLNAFRDEAGEFLKIIDPHGDEPPSEIIRMLNEENAQLKVSFDDTERLSHQVYDMLFLLFELAARFDMDLDTQWIQGRFKKQKYTEK